MESPLPLFTCNIWFQKINGAISDNVNQTSETAVVPRH